MPSPTEPINKDWTFNIGGRKKVKTAYNAKFCIQEALEQLFEYKV